MNEESLVQYTNSVNNISDYDESDTLRFYFPDNAFDDDNDNLQFLYDNVTNLTDTLFNGTTNNGNGTNSDDALEEPQGTAATSDVILLRDTFGIYGGIFLASFFSLCCLRRSFKKFYNLRSTGTVQEVDEAEQSTTYFHQRTTMVDPSLKTPLANSQHGFVSWCWKLFQIDDHDIMDECGMDSLCFIRLCSMGYRITVTGMFTALWLIPAYSTASTTDESSFDNLAEVTTGHLEDQSPRLIATAVATYIIFGHAMYVLLQEMEWFAKMRHRFLMKTEARNYAVYIRNVPKDWRSNRGLKTFFEKSLRGSHVLESHICMRTTHLQQQVDQRAEAIVKLERAVAIWDETGVRPKHREKALLVPVPHRIVPQGKEVDSVLYYAEKLKLMNTAISEEIIVLKEMAKQQTSDLEYLDSDDTSLDEDDEHGDYDNDSEQQESLLESERPRVHKRHSSALLNAVRAPGGALKNAVNSAVNDQIQFAGHAAGLVTKTTAGAVTGAVKLVLKDDDGELFSAGFVVFRTLSTVHAALQMIHHEQPYKMEVIEAPDPDDICWFNVGREHHDLQMGRLASFSLVSIICFFWTVPVSFVAGLSSVDALREEIEWIDNLIEAVPAFEPIFKILAPQLLIILNALLPVILRWVATFEGSISGSIVEASLFSKLAAFTIIQTFFVTTLSGGIMEELQKFIQTPASLVDLLASSLPKQSTFFIQLSFVSTVSTFLMQGLGLVRIAKGIVRSQVGPNLIERERKNEFLGLYPISNPRNFQYADYQASSVVLLFMIYFVYCVIAPLVSFVTAVCFIMLEILFRHQFVYIYKSKPDSGGRLYMNCISVLTFCLLIAEVTVVGLMSLKKTAAAAFLFPLVAATIIFSIYLRDQHFAVADHLPTRLCLSQDHKNRHTNMEFSTEAYLQPALRDPVAKPNLSKQRLRELEFEDEEEVTELRIDIL